MNDFDKHSRVDKFEKRRKNTKSISVLMIAGSLLVVVLLGMWIFGGGDDQASEEKQTTEENKSTNESNNSDTEESNEEQTETDENNSSNSDEQANEANEEESDAETDEDESQSAEDIETEQVEPSGDNVKEAYTGNWEPIGTEQEGPHTTNYSDGSQDRQEIVRAAALATGLNASTLTTHWVGNGGDQKVETTVYNEDQSEIYRVYLSWVDNEGWQPTKVEALNNLPPIN